MHFGQSKCLKQKLISSHAVSHVLPTPALSHHRGRYSLAFVCEGEDRAGEKCIKA